MTMLKVGMMGAALATSLVGGAGKANADVRFGVGPARVSVSAPRFVAPPPARVFRPVVVSSAPRYDRYNNRYNRYHGGYQYGSTVTVYGGNPQPTWQDPQVFAAQIRAEMNQADSDIRFHVQEGSVTPQALASLDSDRQEIERDLADVCGKGYITADDRAHLEQHVQEIRELRDTYSAGYNGQTAYGYR